MKESVADKLRKIASLTEQEALAYAASDMRGLDPVEAESRTEYKKERALGKVFCIIARSFVNPFALILIVVALIALISGLLGEKDNLISAGIIIGIVILSGAIQSVQNLRAHKSFLRVGRFSSAPIIVRRGGVLIEVPASRVVEGDIVVFAAGSRIPADLRIISDKDLRVSQAAVTGESKIVCKNSSKFISPQKLPLPKYSNMVFRGSTVISGKGEGVVVAAGKNTLFGSPSLRRKPTYGRGIYGVFRVLLSFILFFVPVALLVSGLIYRNFGSVLLFTLSVVVGLVPAMLPMVVSVCLSKGSRAMMKKKTLVRNVNTMQGFASTDVICIDKTGTLTGSEITLEYYLDPLGRESRSAISLAYLNARFHGGAHNYVDSAILKFKDNPLFSQELELLSERYKRLDEIPFGYDRKFAAVLLSDGQKNHIICKGSTDEILAKCSRVRCGDKVLSMPQDKRRNADEVIGELLADGMKVLAVAEKETEGASFEREGLSDMVLVGYIVFFDAPKSSAKAAIERLRERSVDVIILTGDDAAVAVSVCKRIGLPCDKVVTGTQLENFSEEELTGALERVKIFAELTPDQKVRIVEGLKANGHTAGYLGDGINDVPALCAADVAISVDTAQDVAKDAADVVLLEKDLNVLADGITEGRKMFTNVQKYVKITAGSNLGNVLALIIASIFLPFQPMIAVQLLMLNILYDIICFTISWDNVDIEEIKAAKSQTGKGLLRFAVLFGTVSTLFDIITFVFLYFFFCPWAAGGSYSSLSGEQAAVFIALFQTGWFIESMWSQTLILNILRTRKTPFVQSKPSAVFLAAVLAGALVFTLVAFTPLGNLIGFVVLPPIYFVYLIAAMILYMAVILAVKKLYNKKFEQSN